MVGLTLERDNMVAVKYFDITGQKRPLYHWLWPVILLIFTGCASTPSPQTYLLEAVTIKPAATPQPSGKTLLIGLPRAAPGFDSRRIAYTREPPKLDYYNNSIWSDAPAKMLLPILVGVLENTGAFTAVISPPSPVLADLRMDVDLIRLQQEFTAQPSLIHLTLRITMIDLKDRRVLGTHVFDTVEPTPGGDASGAAHAANTAIKNLSAKIVRFILTLLNLQTAGNRNPARRSLQRPYSPEPTSPRIAKYSPFEVQSIPLQRPPEYSFSSLFLPAQPWIPGSFDPWPWQGAQSNCHPA
ncbi:MAG: hypothetical protein CSA09_00755 [Candidatus Contendobacter odensis]|uniref:ABC-type transport auxiliary lipoprotein component domain-containing protein n=1 Tax=Candidatus Contendibacter odensensis TaxID=1400860 RepID=A0A2G6PFW8_9GAMM|nr:MAG: hypothetical protein CSA09_00755 [Candidatus Contendobacter odensis]